MARRRRRRRPTGGILAGTVTDRYAWPTVILWSEAKPKKRFAACLMSGRCWQRLQVHDGSSPSRLPARCCRLIRSVTWPTAWAGCCFYPLPVRGSRRHGPRRSSNLCHTPAASLDAPLRACPKNRCGGLATRLHRGKRQTREGVGRAEQWGNRYPGVIRIWRPGVTPNGVLKVPARASLRSCTHPTSKVSTINYGKSPKPGGISPPTNQL